MNRRAELFELTRVRVLLFLREPGALFWVFVFPLLMAGVLGYAFRSKGVAPTRVGLLEGPGVEALAATLAQDEFIELVPFRSAEEARKKLSRAVVDVVLEPRGDDPPRLAFDPARQEGENARVRVLRAMEHPRLGSGIPVALEPVTETGSRYIDFLFPGLLGMNLMGTGMWGVGFAIADVRRRKFLRRLLVTPMRRWSFFLSFILARGVFLVLELLVFGLFGLFVLDVPLRGAVVDCFVVAVLGALTFAGMGILTTSRARTIETASGLMNFVMMPMWLGSGVFFPTERFPEAAQPFLRVLPLTALNDALRGVCLDGASLTEVAGPVALLLAWGVLSTVIALRIFRWD